MVKEVVVEVRLFNSYVGLRGRGRWRVVGGGRGWTDLPGILLNRKSAGHQHLCSLARRASLFV